VSAALPFGGPDAVPGEVYLVGGGPGDPGLVGLRAAHLLATATFVAYDRLAPKVCLRLCRDDAELVYVGKLPDRHALAQEDINRLLVAKARAGHAVVRWKGGDPFVLARGSEEAAACVEAGVAFEVVPAVTSGIAAPAYAGIPVTHRGVSPAFAVVTGHEDPTKPGTQVHYDALARFPGTLLLYMGVGRLRAIAAALVAGGRPGTEPVALVRWGTTARQETLTGTLADIADTVDAAGFANPAIIVVGAVAALRDQLRWYDTRPLHGLSVLVPRTRQQASALSDRLRALGAEPVEAPTIAIEPGREPERLRAELAAAADGAYDWMALTSVNGVDAVFAAIAAMGADARLLARVRVAVVGSGTAEALTARGVRADLVPERFTTTGLADALLRAPTPPGRAPRMLLPRADIATPVLTRMLAEAGWDAVEVEAYRTVPVPALDPEVRQRLDDGGIDLLAFASSSTVRNFVDLYDGPVLGAVASIGPVTTETCRQLGLTVAAEADPHDIAGLVQAVVAAARQRWPKRVPAQTAG